MIVPGTGQKLTDGDVVMLSEYPGVKWIIQYGWYTYYNYRYSGWYFSSIPDNTILPVAEEDLTSLVVISTNNSIEVPSSSCDCDCNCNGSDDHIHPTPKPPRPDPPGPLMGLTPSQELSRAWISVDTIVDRNSLNTRILPDGKIVRVNNTEDGPKYYIWNKVRLEWNDFEFESTSGGLQKEEADTLYASKDTEKLVKEIKKEVEAIQDGPIWEILSDVISGD